jgi:glycogen(starch) synthase
MTRPDGLPAVALISSSFAPHVGGVETHVDRVAVELSRRGHPVEVWTVDRGEHLGIRDVDGLRVRYLPTPLPARRATAALGFGAHAPAAWARWTAAHREFAPDLLHVHCFGPNGVYGTMLSRRFGTPLIVTSHGETAGDDHGAFQQSALLRRFLRAGIGRAAAVTAPSDYVLAELRSGYGLGVGQVVPNGVDLAPTSSTRTPELLRPEGSYLFAVGRLGRPKGFDLLLTAYARAGLDSVRLVIGGDGPEHAALSALIHELRLDDRVELVGMLDPASVAELMAGALAVVVPSRVEAFGIVALEAWRSGTPLVMSVRGGASEFMRDGDDALLVDPVETERLAGVIRRISGDAALRARLSEAGARRWREFTWQKVVDDYEDLYRRAVSPRG